MHILTPKHLISFVSRKEGGRGEGKIALRSKRMQAINTYLVAVQL
jgi:hypothetical protein